MSGASSSRGPLVARHDSYDIDSDEYPSDSYDDFLDDEEVFEWDTDDDDNGFTIVEMEEMMDRMREIGMYNFLREYRYQNDGACWRKLLHGLGKIIPKNLRHPSTQDIELLPYTKLSLLRILRQRAKLPQYNTVEDAVHLLRKSKNIIVLTGAGISTSCGIPDFRSAEGLYAQLQQNGKYDLDDPQQMFDIHFFREHPEIFYSFAKQIYPSNFTPSPCHRWIKLLEDKGVLLRNYTQNIDTLESQAGVTKVLNCHGSFKTASCLRCNARQAGHSIKPYIMAQQVPYCPSCLKRRRHKIKLHKAEQRAKRKAKRKGNAKKWDGGSESEIDEDEHRWPKGEPGIIKPDITFFGQALDFKFDECLSEDREKVDLLVIIGTSLNVAPVSEVGIHIPHSVPQILINMTPVSHANPDICLLGDADMIVTDLSRRLGWKIPPALPKNKGSPLSETQGASTGGHPGIEDGTVEPVWVQAKDGRRHVHTLLTFKNVSDDIANDASDEDEENSITAKPVSRPIKCLPPHHQTIEEEDPAMGELKHSLFTPDKESPTMKEGSSSIGTEEFLNSPAENVVTISKEVKITETKTSSTERVLEYVSDNTGRPPKKVKVEEKVRMERVVTVPDA